MKSDRVLLLVFLFLALIFPVFLAGQKVFFSLKAKGVPAQILVDVSVDQGLIFPIWQGLAQGGEEKFPFAAIQKEVSHLKPKYIRVDHIYDFYNLVKKEENKLVFDWRELDILTDQILATGAFPFFSLSYMPPAIAQNGEITSPPNDWFDWSELVQKTIEHYSGRNNRNLKDVIYEVWNEPDLFGNWKITGTKDYRLLYKYSIEGAEKAQNTNPFKIGGPGTTAPYKNWVDNFLKYIFENHLRLDFYSWHRYSLQPKEYLADIDRVDTWLFQNAGYTLPKYLTEWAISSENSVFNDNLVGAAHLVATIRQLIQRLDFAFVFEIKDGLNPSGQKYYGRWGILTHEGAGEIEKKPRYQALEFLNQMAGRRIKLEGEGTWVTGFATKNNQTVKIILVNFDSDNVHFEKTPLAIVNLENGNYSYQETSLAGLSKNLDEKVSNRIFNKEILLTPNNVVLIELTKI